MIDSTDKKILKLLSLDAAMSATDIGNTVGLSVPAVNKRIARMRSVGIIKNFTVITDEKQVGKSVTAFILLVLQYGDAVDKLMEHIKSDPDILECYAVTGEYDYIIKICASGVEVLEEKLLSLKRQKGVIKSHTMLSLMEHKFNAAVLPDEVN